MSAAVIQQSIEALYREAEAVVHQDQPMLTIIQSFPPTIDASHLSVVADSSTDLVDIGNANADQVAVWRRIEDLLDEAERVSTSTAAESAEAEFVEDITEYSAEDLQAPAEDAVTTVSAPLEDDTPIATQAAIDATIADQDADQAIASEAQMMAIPTEPPAPDQLDGADTMAEADISVLLNEAKADSQAVAAPIDPEDDIDSVMADIAAAVGVVEPQPTSRTPVAQAKPMDAGTVTAEPLPAQAATPQASQQAAPTEALATFISETVRAVLAEELPGMVKQAVTDALRTAAPAAPAAKKTASKKASAKKASAKKATAKKTTGKKATGKKTTGKKTTGNT